MKNQIITQLSSQFFIQLSRYEPLYRFCRHEWEIWEQHHDQFTNQFHNNLYDKFEIQLKRLNK